MAVNSVKTDVIVTSNLNAKVDPVNLNMKHIMGNMVLERQMRTVNSLWNFV